MCPSDSVIGLQRPKGFLVVDDHVLEIRGYGKHCFLTVLTMLSDWSGARQRVHLPEEHDCLPVWFGQSAPCWDTPPGGPVPHRCAVWARYSLRRRGLIHHGSDLLPVHALGGSTATTRAIQSWFAMGADGQGPLVALHKAAVRRLSLLIRGWILGTVDASTPFRMGSGAV